MIVKLLTEHQLEFLSLKEAAEARLSLHMSKCHIVGNLMHWLIIILTITTKSSISQIYSFYSVREATNQQQKQKSLQICWT